MNYLNIDYTFERISGKKSLSRICADDPSRISEMAALLASEGKKLHATVCDTTYLLLRKKSFKDLRNNLRGEICFGATILSYIIINEKFVFN